MMMYQDRLAVAIKVNGKVLRETKSPGSDKDDTVLIPFGSEYTLYFKNMNSVRALVRVEIDGQDATEGVSLIVPANGTLELERFIKNANFNSGQRFKFIERTKKIEDGPRGIGVEDGLVRIEFEFEREPARIRTPDYYVDPYPWKRDVHHHHWHRSIGDVKLGSITGSIARGTTGDASDLLNQSRTISDWAGDGAATASLDSAPMQAYNMSAASFSASASAADVSFTSTSAEVKTSGFSPQPTKSAMRGKVKTKSLHSAAPVNDKGITVGGSVSDQSFHYGSWFPTDGVKHVMIVKLLGNVGQQRVEKAVTVKAKQECPTCGTKNKFGTKFCRECGTGLIVA